MKKVVQYAVDERMSQSGFSNEATHDRLSLYAFYQCPKCAQKVRFEKSDFAFKKDAQASNLSSSDQQLFQQFSDNPDQDFLDFYCPACNSAVRINFLAWAGGRHGDSGITFLNIQEITELK